MDNKLTFANFYIRPDILALPYDGSLSPRHADFDKTRELDGTKMLHTEISDFTGRDTINCGG
jgi:hypothetical protein